VLDELVAETDAIAKQNAEWERMVAIIADAHFGLIGFGEEIKVVSVATNEWVKTLEASLGDALVTAAVQLGDALVDAAFGAKVNWEQTIKSILVGLAKAVIMAVILKAVESALVFSGGGIVPAASGGGIAGQSFSRGGVVYAAGGMFTPRGTDTVPAMLTPGEMVIPRDATQSILGGRASLVGAGAARQVNLTVVAMDSASFETFLTRNPRALRIALDHMDSRGY
jgi:hypothetical protein